MIRHLACIMDGNRRWANAKGLASYEGHRGGVESVMHAIEFCIEKQIAYLSLYAFSLENFKRSEQEKRYLFQLIVEQIALQIPRLIKEQIRVRFVGDKTVFPASIQEVCAEAEQSTKAFSKLELSILLCYGGRQEVVAAVRSIVHDYLSQPGSSIDAIDEHLIESKLWTGHAPAPDIIIRTSGVRRLSNFLLYQSGYSELFFLDCMWPDLSKKDLELVLDEFQKRKRNFGV